MSLDLFQLWKIDIDKLRDKYKKTKSIYAGFIKILPSGINRFTKTLFRDHDTIAECIIIPRGINRAFITLDTLIIIIENIKQHIDPFIIVNQYGITAISPNTRLRNSILSGKYGADNLLKDRKFIRAFFAHNHEPAKIQKIIRDKGFILSHVNI